MSPKNLQKNKCCDNCIAIGLTLRNGCRFPKEHELKNQVHCDDHDCSCHSQPKEEIKIVNIRKSIDIPCSCGNHIKIDLREDGYLQATLSFKEQPPAEKCIIDENGYSLVCYRGKNCGCKFRHSAPMEEWDKVRNAFEYEKENWGKYRWDLVEEYLAEHREKLDVIANSCREQGKAELKKRLVERLPKWKGCKSINDVYGYEERGFNQCLQEVIKLIQEA